MKGKVFIEPIFHGTVKGRITQFREIMKPQPITVFYGMPVRGYDNQIGIKDNKPRYKVGETVYLKEPYYVSNLMVKTTEYKYGSDLPVETINRVKWKNKLFMPAKYARYFIKINAVRCERLQDISDEDCFKEGVIKCKYFDEIFYSVPLSNNFKQYTKTPRYTFSFLIDSISGRGTWDSNPYVWVYEFTLISKSFDQILEDNKDILND